MHDKVQIEVSSFDVHFLRNKETFLRSIHIPPTSHWPEPLHSNPVTGITAIVAASPVFYF